METKITLHQLSKNNQGSIALLLSMIVLTAILTVVLTASEIIRNGLVADKNQLDSTKAYFTAEAAAERILWHVRKNSPPDNIAACNIGQYINFSSDSDHPSVASILCVNGCSLANNLMSLADYKYCIKYELPGDTKLTCYGDYKGVRRAVEVIF